jgi:hypothetical protein
MADNQGDDGRRKDGYGHHGKWPEFGGGSVWAGHRYHRFRGPGVIFAALMISAGILLFLDNIGLFHFGNIWQYWPVALIAVGVSKLFECRGAGGMVWGGMMIVAGGCFLLSNLGLMHVGFDVIWPLALVAFGVLMLTNALDRRGISGPSATRSAGNMSPENTSPENTLKEWVVFSGAKRKFDTKNFQGGEMLAVFGGIEVDLRRAGILSADREVVIGVTSPRLVVTGYAVFGGVSIEN